MMTPSLTDLDTLRAAWMCRLLTPDGQQEIWKYDVCAARIALGEAIDRQDYDNLMTGIDARQAGTPFALIGPGICDHYFSTPSELIALVRWLCVQGYLSCYAANEMEES